MIYLIDALLHIGTSNVIDDYRWDNMDLDRLGPNFRLDNWVKGYYE